MNATDCSFTASPAVRFLVAIAAACTALGAGAETYKLTNEGSKDTPSEWGTAANWSPEGVPGDSDSITWDTYGDWNFGACIALDQDRTISAFASSYRYMNLYRTSAASTTVTLTIQNELGNGSYTGFRLYDGVKLALPAECVIRCSHNDRNPTLMHVFGGAEANIYGQVSSRTFQCNVEENGTLIFAPVSYSAQSKSDSSDGTKHDHDEFNIGGGTASFPNGISLTGNSTSSSPELFNQTGGTVIFGGDFASTIPWTYTWSAGTLNITDNCAFGNNVSLVLPANSSVTLDVASGKTFSAPNVSTEYPVTITKTGGGTFAMPQTAATVSVTAGGLSLGAGTYDLSNVSFASQTKIVLSTLGATITGFQSAFIANVTFEADLSGVTAGSVVISSSNADLLAKAKSNLDASVPAGFDLVISGGTLAVEAETAGKFTITGDILGTAGWGGTIPADGSDVSIDGTDVVATYSGGTLPAWNSIEVKNGATLRVAANLTLPKIILNKNATLAIGNNAVVTLANIADLTGTVATTPDVVVPALSVESGATLNVPGGMKFSNVNISLAGTIAASAAGGITFGYAALGETTYIGLTANGGTISIEPGSGDYNTSNLRFCCPEAGGTVNVIGSGRLTLSNTTILPQYVRDGKTYNLTINYQIGFYVGVNNPASIPFELVFDNTKWGAMGSFYVKGGATFRLENGGAYRNFESIGYWGRYAQIAENGRIVVCGGSEFRMNALGDYGSHPLEVIPASDGHKAIVVEDGGIFETYRFSGNDKAVFAASNSVYTIYMPSIYNEHYSQSSQTTTIYDTTNIPFAGFSSVDVAQNCTLTFSTRNKVFWDEGQFGDDSGDRVVSLANVPITGGGSIALSNDNVNVFGVIVTCGENTAGTVDAGGFVMTNLVNATAACTNSFGTLNLASGGEVKIRVWKTGDAITTHDGLNVGKYINNGGRITLVQMGEQFVAADKFILGTIDDDSPLPSMSKPWRAERDGEGNLFAKASSGLSVVIR